MPVSQNGAIKQIQDDYLPLMAQIALISGRLTGDLNALKFALVQIADRQTITCQTCGSPLDATGGGHTGRCELRAQAVEVLDASPDAVRRRLLARKSRLQQEGAKVDHELDALGSKTGAA